MKVLIIPSAVLVPREMRSKLGDMPAILYPLNSKPMIDHLYEKYKDEVDDIYVVAYKKSNLVKDYISIKNYPIKVVLLDQLKDIGYTIATGLNAAYNDHAKIDYTYINFADTLIENSFGEFSSNVSIFSEENYSQDWTYFSLEGNKIKTIIDKNDTIHDQQENEFKTFVGVFGIENTEEFKKYLEDELKQGFFENDSFYRAWGKFTNERNCEFTKAEKWFDAGHSDRYLKAKTGVEARAFNSIEIDEKRGILTKRSQNVDKFIDEIMWYVKMPNKLQYLIPRVYDYSTDRYNAYISMEYYGYNTLHELFVFGNLPLYRWQSIFEKIRFIISDMRQYKVTGHEQEKIDAMKDMYITKTIDRLNKLRKDKNFSEFFTHDITINGEKYHSLDYYINMLPEYIEERLIKDQNIDFNVIHGDLCFSNVLIEENYGFMRILDPRGRFGSFDIYGDGRYELAKLMHSVEGKYDFIIEDMVKLTVEETSIDYEVTGMSRNISKVFEDIFADGVYDYKDLQLIESLLFLSMIPLHNDSVSRQYAMLATGLELLRKSKK